MKRKFCLTAGLLLAGTLVFCIVFTMCPKLIGTGPVLAQEPDSAPVEVLQEQSEAAWRNQSQDDWQYCTFAEAINNVRAGGSVMLLSDVSLTSGITISKSGQGMITITSHDPRNPCVIRNTERDTADNKDAGRIFTVTAGALKLQDIILDGGKDEGITAYHPLICVKGNVRLEMRDGAVLRNAENRSQSMCGGGINVRQGQVYLYDGSQITHCKARHGGGIQVNCISSDYRQAAFGMTGGSIDNCEADAGGGVYVNIGQFMMQGGKISENRAMREDAGGGGIYVAGESNTAAVRIAADGEITNNKAKSEGGGILIRGAYALAELLGGTLKENTANCAGGVSVSHGTLRLHGGTVTDNTADLYGGGILGTPNSVIELKGNPKVYGNAAGDTTDRFDNLYLDGAEDDEPSSQTSPVRLTGALTEGVRLGMSRWLRPDEKEHPYREMIVPGTNHPISQSDWKRLCDDRQSDDKELYADNMEKYALIPYDGKIVMVLAVGITLDSDSLSLRAKGDTAAITASVTPYNAPVKEVTWTSSDESVATVDENGNVTAIGKGTALITATTVSPYHETASCQVMVGKFRLTTQAEQGELQYTSDAGGSDTDNEIFEEDDSITIQPVPDKGYQLKEDSLRACRTDDETVSVDMEGNTFRMPDYDVTVKAVFEPVSYSIIYEMEGGALEEDTINPDAYTIESKEITLNNPVRDGYSFVGWTGTGLGGTQAVVKIPSGSTGARKFTAVWKKENKTPSPSPSVPTEEPKTTEKPQETKNPNITEKPEETEKPDITEKPKETEKPNITDKPEKTAKPKVTEKPKITEKPEGTKKPEATEKPETKKEPEVTEKPEGTEKPRVTKNPGTTEKRKGTKKPGGVKKSKTMENPKITEKPKVTKKPENIQTEQSPQTGSRILLMYAAAILSALCMLILTVLYRKRQKK